MKINETERRRKKEIPIPYFPFLFRSPPGRTIYISQVQSWNTYIYVLRCQP
jgi:hypothetical protein